MARYRAARERTAGSEGHGNDEGGGRVIVNIGEPESSRRAAHEHEGIGLVRRTITGEEWATVTGEVYWAPPRSAVKVFTRA